MYIIKNFHSTFPNKIKCQVVPSSQYQYRITVDLWNQLLGIGNISIPHIGGALIFFYGIQIQIFNGNGNGRSQRVYCNIIVQESIHIYILQTCQII